METKHWTLLCVLSLILQGTSLVAADAQHAATESNERPIDKSRVWRFERQYSRGNDDANENRRYGTVFETAKVNFELVVKEENGKYQFWMIVKPTLSTSELKGARTAIGFGARPMGATNRSDLTPEEQEALYERAKKEAQRIIAENKALLEEKKKLESLQREEREAIEAAFKALEALGIDGEASAEDSTEKIERWQALIKKARVAKRNPGTDERAEKLPIGHLQGLIREEQTILGKAKKLEEEIATRRDTERRLSEEIVNTDRRRQYEGTPMRATSRVEGRLRGTGFVPFRFESPSFRRDVYSRTFDPKGEKMEATVYLGESEIPKKKNGTISGMVSLQRARSSRPYHEIPWSVSYQNGEITAADVVPSNRAKEMWKLLNASVRTPDGKKSTDASTAPVTEGYAQKPEPRRVQAPVASKPKASADEPLASSFPSLGLQP